MRQFANWIAPSAAVFIAGTLQGCAVYDIYQKCGVSGCSGDAEITSSVENRFDRHPAVGPPNLLRVQTLDKVVYLNGYVATDLQRSIADRLAMRTPGVTRVVNNIAVYNK